MGRPWALAILIFTLSLALFAFTVAPRFQGYEAETAAVTEGLLLTGAFVALERSPLRSGWGYPGRGGRLYGRAGIVQPLLQVPFYLAGRGLEVLGASPGRRPLSHFLLRFYNAVIVALTATVLFSLVLKVRRSRLWAATIAVLFSAATIAWPYAKIGMEPTLMLALALCLLAIVHVVQRPGRAWPWLALGASAGAAVATKPYAILPVAGICLGLLPTLRALGPRRMVTLLCLSAGPFIAWVAVALWYNAHRTGSLLGTSNEAYAFTLAAPFNAIGLLVSPGKGLLLYSPLAILGVAGIVQLWRTHRWLALSVAGGAVFGVIAISGSAHWSEDTWGPRYLVPISWLFLLPIAWWATTPRRRQVLLGVAVFAVLIQGVAVTLPYKTSANGFQALTGSRLVEQRTDPADVRQADNRSRVAPARSRARTPIRGIPWEGTVPFGRDPTRWIPEVSPLVFQTQVLASVLLERTVGAGFSISYRPYEGLHRTVDAAHPQRSLRVQIPDFWWASPGAGLGGQLLAAFFALVALAAGAILGLAVRTPGSSGATDTVP